MKDITEGTIGRLDPPPSIFAPGTMDNYLVLSSLHCHVAFNSIGNSLGAHDVTVGWFDSLPDCLSPCMFVCLSVCPSINITIHSVVFSERY